VRVANISLQIFEHFLLVNFGDGNWQQAEAWIVLRAEAAEVNAFAQGALQQFTHSKIHAFQK